MYVYMNIYIGVHMKKGVEDANLLGGIGTNCF